MNEAFEKKYEELLGERWRELRPALLKEARHTDQVRSPAGEIYWMDLASVLAAQCLQVCPGQRVLDLCAAPGGKSLVIAQSLFAGGIPEPGTELVANERSAARRGRLKKVLDEFLSPETRERVRVTGHDASRWSLHEKNMYDRVLLDAPCSSERHVMAMPEELKQWTRNRSPQLAMRQYAMLVAALDVLKPGGKLVYSTCAVSPLENDEVVRRLIQKKKKRIPFEVEKITDCPIGEPTELGWQIFPDRCDGWGPIYFSRILKLGDDSAEKEHSSDSE